MCNHHIHDKNRENMTDNSLNLKHQEQEKNKQRFET